MTILGETSALYLSRAVEPKRIACDIDQVAGLLCCKRKADHVTSLDANRAMACRRGSHDQPLTILSFEKLKSQMVNADGIST